MNDDNTRKLFKRFKFLNKKTLLNGFECEDGWYSLIYDMCKELKSCAGLPENFVVTRIMERFGELEVYTKNGNMPTRFVLKEYNERSVDICDRCGNDRDLQSCDKCTVPEIDYSNQEEDEPEEDDGNSQSSCGTSCAPSSGGG